MSFSGPKNILRFSLTLLALFGLAFSVTCVFDHPEISTHAVSSTIGTFFTSGNEACCSINTLSYHKFFSDQYPAIPRDTTGNFVVLFIVGLTALIIFERRFLQDIGRRLSLLYKMYIRDNPELDSFNHLRLAFSQGILNPKKYNLIFVS